MPPTGSAAPSSRTCALPARRWRRQIAKQDVIDVEANTERITVAVKRPLACLMSSEAASLTAISKAPAAVSRLQDREDRRLITQTVRRLANA